MRSYAIHRPIGPFTWPSEHADKVAEIVNWDERRYVEEVGRWAFGYIDWAEDVPMEDLRRYELMVTPTEDAQLERIGEILARYNDPEHEERFMRAWDKAMELYGYSEDQILASYERHVAQG